MRSPVGYGTLWLGFAVVTSQVTLGSQTFSRWAQLCDGLDQTASIALGDLDGDGDLDAVFAYGMHVAQTDWVFSNDGRGMFYGRRALGTGAVASPGINPDASFGVALGDLDGDGMRLSAGWRHIRSEPACYLAAI